QKQEWLPRLVSGEVPAAVALAEGEPVLGGGLARLLVIAGRDGCALVEEPSMTPAPGLDPTRRLARFAVGRGEALAVGPERARQLAVALAAAEAAGVAAWCLETASSYAKVREQFGRPIGQFQAVKHRCANMLPAVEQARAVAWDAALAASHPDEAPLAAAVAGSLALDAAAGCAQHCIQGLGRSGFP